jgi:hypothetical protein
VKAQKHGSSELAAAVRRWPTPRAKAWTLRFLRQAAVNEDIVAVVAVGSAVRAGVPSADLDLVVVSGRPAALDPPNPIEVDVRTYQADDVTRQIAEGNDLLGWAVKFGCLVFQRDGYWSALVSSWRDQLPLPKAEIALQRAQAAARRLAKMLEVGDMEAAEEQALACATHRARAELLKQSVYPASRPELPGQLRAIGGDEAADALQQLLDPTADHGEQLRRLAENARLTTA